MAKKRWRVAGQQPVAAGGRDRVPGEVFEADLEPAQEATLVACGALVEEPLNDTVVGVYPPGQEP